MTIPPYKAAIFDFDGVVVNTEDVFAEFDCGLLNEVLHDHGIEERLTTAYVRSLAGNSAKRKLEMMAERFGFDYDQCQESYGAKRDELRKSLFINHPVPIGKNIRDYTQELGKDRVALATNKKSSKLLSDLETMGISDLFDIIVPCDPPLHRKPEPDVVLGAIDKLGIDAENCIYIGDNPNDMIAAKAAGCTGIGFMIDGLGQRAEQEKALKDAGAEMVIDDFMALTSYYNT